MKHELASEKLLELAYGELSPREARDVEAHAAGCERCREELAGIRETRSLMAQLPVEPAPERGEGIVMAAARAAAEARSRGRPLLPPWLWAGSIGAVTAVVLAVVSWQLTREPIRPSHRPQSSDLMGNAQPTVAMKEEPPAKRESMAKEKTAAAPPPPAEEAKGRIGFAEARRDRAEETEVARAAGGLGIMGAAPKARPSSGADAATAAVRPRQAPGTVEVRKFPSCPGERRRVLEYAADGSLLRYLREGDVRSVEQRFDPDGRLVAAFAIERGVRRALPLDSPGLARDAGDAVIGAPPSCGP